MMPTLKPAEGDAVVDLVRTVSAAEILRGFRRMEDRQVTTKTSPVDLVTEYDRRAEARLSAGLAKIFPDAAIIGEEAASAEPGLIDRLDADGRVVVIDPIDGTWNYAAGIGVFGVLIAVVQDRRTLFGLLFDPLGDDWVRVEPGAGAWFFKDGAAPYRLKVSTVPRHRGFTPHRFPFQSQLLDGIDPHTRLTALGCSCHEYRTLVLGQADFLLTTPAKPWDHLAGMLALAEAGGHASRPDLTRWDLARSDDLFVAARSGAVVDRVSAALGCQHRSVTAAALSHDEP